MQLRQSELKTQNSEPKTQNFLYLSFVIASAILLFIVTATAQTTTTRPVLTTVSTPENGGFSSERLKRLDNVLTDYVEQGKMNCAVSLIIRNGKIVQDDIFRIASQTKAITSVAVMMLYEEGKFMLDEPVSNYIPEFKNPKVLDKFNKEDTSYTSTPAKREITIRDLLTHTSGIGYAQIGSAEANAIYAKAGVVGGIGVDKLVLGDGMKKLALFHNPGEKWTYGLNTDLLGYLVEVVSGMNLDEFFRKRIFEPLGMKDTYFYLPKEKYNRLAMLYTEDKTTKKAVKMQEKIVIGGKTFYRDYPILEGTYYSGGGGLSSTIVDYAIFLQMMLNGGEYNGKRILSRNSVRMMTMNQIGDLNVGANKFGLGFGITTERGSAAIPTQEGTFDWGGMFATTYWVDPKEKLIGLLYRNIWPTSNNLGNLYKVLVYQAINN
jgi:CubicO group peptidase (beta-lactamase class C family)